MSNSGSFMTKSDVFTEKSGQMDDTFKRLQDITRNSFQMIEDFSRNISISYFDNLCQTIGQNIDLLEELEDKQQKRLKTIILKSNISIENKPSNELLEKDLINESIALNKSLESLSCELKDRKERKTQLTNKTKALTKQLEEMENSVKDLKRNNNSYDSNEYLTLASVMRVMYKTWNNSKVIGLLFNDNEEKSLDRLIVIDRDNKSEQQMAQQFWESLEKDYQINQ